MKATTMRDLCSCRSRIGFWKGVGEGKKFFPLTNFSFKFTKFVKAPDELAKYAGFMVKVTQPQGGITVEGLVMLLVSIATIMTAYFYRSCFLPWYQVSNSDQLCSTLGSAIPNSVLSCKLSPFQIKDLLMKKWEA